MKTIKFYKVWNKPLGTDGRVMLPYGYMSNFSPHGFTDAAEVQWPTAEHFFQAQKFNDPEIREKIRLADTPWNAAVLGRNTEGLREDWDTYRDFAMFEALLFKYSCNEDIGIKLLQTRDAILIEDSPKDSYWGCGKDGKGRNQLGRTHMLVRNFLLMAMITEGKTLEEIISD